MITLVLLYFETEFSGLKSIFTNGCKCRPATWLKKSPCSEPIKGGRFSVLQFANKFLKNYLPGGTFKQINFSRHNQ